MILVDRELTELERTALAGRDVLDLTQREPPVGPGPLQQQLWKWLFNSGDLPMNGTTVREFFRLGPSSYWLHVRARIFHTLLRHAQILDRIGDPTILATIRTVYCSNADSDFWSWWVPTAERKLDVSLKPDSKVPAVKFAIGEMRRFPRYFREYRSAIKRRARAVLFSKAAFNVSDEGHLVDREFASLLAACPDRWIRIEYMELPTVEMKARAPVLRDGPRASATVESNALLLMYLIRKPWAALVFLRNLRATKRRFESALDLEFPLHDEAGRWSALLGREIRRVGPSVAFLHLQEMAVESFLGRLSPPVVLVSGENNSNGRPVVDSARRLGVPTFGIQHGDITSTNVDYALNAREAKQALPDFFLTWGERTRRFLIEHRHYDPDRTWAVGHLLSDRLNLTRSIPNTSDEQTGQRTLLFTSQPQPFARNRLVSAELLAEFCREHRMICRLRLHPRELSGDIYDAAFAKAGIPERLVRDTGELYDAIFRCDIGSTCYSTTAWEMMRVGKPVVIFDPFRMDLLGLRGEDAVFHADNDADFEAWYRDRASHVADAERLAGDFFGPEDGRTADRVISKIEGVVGPICSGPSRAP